MAHGTYIIVAVILCLCITVPVLAIPSIEFDKTAIDVGDAWPSKTLGCVFNFKNVGDENIEIIGIDKECGCTTVKPDSTNIKPGESSELKVEFIAPVEMGSVTKTITVRTNDPVHTSIVLTIKANIIPIAKVNPQNVNFGTIKKGMSCEKIVVVTLAHSDSLKINAVECHGKCVSISEYGEVDSENRMYYIKLNINPGDESGRILEIVKIITNITGADTNFLVYGDIE